MKHRITMQVSFDHDTIPHKTDRKQWLSNLREWAGGDRYVTAKVVKVKPKNKKT